MERGVPLSGVRNIAGAAASAAAGTAPRGLSARNMGCKFMTFRVGKLSLYFWFRPDAAPWQLFHSCNPESVAA